MVQVGVMIFIAVLTTLIDKFTYFNFYESFTMVLLALIITLLIEVWKK